MSGYIGVSPVPQTTQTRDRFVATSGQTTFATSGYTPNYLDVYLNGIKLDTTDYTATNGSDVVLTVGATLNDVVDVVAFSTFEVQGDISASSMTISGSTTLAGLTVSGDTITVGDGHTFGSNSTNDNLEIISSSGENVILKSGGGVLTFSNSSSEYGRFDSSGNLLVGKTAIDPSVIGAEMRAAGYLIGTASSAAAGYFNRTTNDGDVVVIRKGNIDTGFLGVSSDNFFISASDVGLLFDSGNADILPSNRGSTTDAQMDLGRTTTRFKDLYLSGGAIATYASLGATSNSYQTVTGSGDGNDLTYRTYANHIWKNTTGASSTTDGTERMRLNSSGQLLVGKTSPNTATVGVELHPDASSGYALVATGNSQRVAILNRLTSDGEILSLRKDGTTVGSIGTTGGEAYIGSGDTGIRFLESGDAILPHNTSTNLVRDAGIDIGASSFRFKDLFLSGGVYLGGTGASNHLDDYEEGTWTPSITFGGANTGMTYSSQLGTYVKVGNVVHAKCYLNLSSKGTSTGNVLLNGLPFSTGSGLAYCTFAIWINNLLTGGEDPTGYAHPTGTFIYLQKRSSGVTSIMQDTDFANNSEVMVQITYEA